MAIRAIRDAYRLRAMWDRNAAAAALTKVRAAHRGDVSVGPADADPDLVVEVGDPMDWSFFDGMTTPAGGLWPRWITYVGDDTSVFAWARERHVEGLKFRPVTSGLVLDVSAAHIDELVIDHGDLPVTVEGVTGGHIRTLTFVGEPSALTVLATPGQPPEPLPRITLRLPHAPTPNGVPAPADGSAGSRALPPIPGLGDVESLEIATAPLDVPLDLRSLTQFRRLRKLSLRGAIARPEALADLALTELNLRMAPDLTGLPPLATWPELASFLTWNIDAVTGRQLRADLKKRGLTAQWETTDDGATSAAQVWSVSQLRTASWFVTESGLPFAAWSRKQSKPAVAAFKTAARQLDAAATATATDRLAVARDAIEGFTRALNEIGDLETPEREDAATAVLQLARLAVPPVPDAEALAWFDELRDF
ncbi:hypothetical protein ABH935_007242 [Catenulispora sp. GAS73]|uniref:hypothetical protein n=1 Tax=Catenulispora sp. GAS73 TaxID=3156269 RepID=UPI00351858DB